MLKPLDHLPPIGTRIYLHDSRDSAIPPRPATVAHMRDVHDANPGLGLRGSELNEPYIDNVIRGFIYDDDQGGADLCIMYFSRECAFNSLVSVDA